MLILHGVRAGHFAQAVVSALRELAGPDGIREWPVVPTVEDKQPKRFRSAGPIKIDAKWEVSESQTQIRTSGTMPSADSGYFVAWTIINTVAIARKHVQITEQNLDEPDAGRPMSTFDGALGYVKFSLIPLDFLVWSNKEDHTTKWETMPIHIQLGHELVHAMHWVLGKFMGQSWKVVQDAERELYKGPITLPDGKKYEAKPPIGGEEAITMATENVLREQSRRRGKKVGERAVYELGRDTKSGRVLGLKSK